MNDDGPRLGEVVLTGPEFQNVRVLAQYAKPEELYAPPEPGERCALCNRRRNRKRTTDSPKVREVRFRAPADVIEAIEEQFDMLQEFTGLDPYGFPRARLLEALLLLGIQQREEIAAHFKGDESERANHE